uniref:Solute carrier family 35 member D2 n=1 Tax=Sinocyclocheilus anshuiensis TaxID=1608454 RepID=A0A671KEV6_9TELE
MNKAIHFQLDEKRLLSVYIYIYIYNISICRKTFAPSLVCSVLAVVVGSLTAASSDLSFNAEGYTFVLLNDVFTAASGVYTKKNSGWMYIRQLELSGLGKYGVVFIIMIPTVRASAYTGDLQKALSFEGWMSLMFRFHFLLSCVMGVTNSFCALHFVSCVFSQNVAVAYIGMFIGLNIW